MLTLELTNRQCVFNTARRLSHQVLKLGSLKRFNTSHVQHADARTIRPKQWRTCAAVNRIRIKKVLTPVQPYGLQLCQGSADGGGGQLAFRQIGADTGNEVGPGVTSVYCAVGINHHAVRISQHRKIAGSGDGTAQTLQHGTRGLHKGAVGFQQPLYRCRQNHVKSDFLLWPFAAGKAALPRPLYPGLHTSPWVADAILQNRLPRQGNLLKTRVTCEVGC